MKAGKVPPIRMKAPFIRIPDASDPAAALASVVALRGLADRLELAAAQSAMTQGWTWAQVAEALGVSRQAVHKKLAHRIRH
jgi:transcriptional regulator of acetoin/glycerol metabolism